MVEGAGHGTAGRLVLALGAIGAAAAFLGRVTPAYWPEGDVAHWLATAPPEAPVLALAGAAAYGCLAWLAVVLLAVTARTRVRLPGRAFAERVLGVAALTAAAGAVAVAPAAADGGPFDRLAPPAAAAASTAPGPAVVVVRRGDTLWGFAGPEWPRWYAANRAVIGDDPDLILPGQRLVVPGGAAR